MNGTFADARSFRCPSSWLLKKLIKGPMLRVVCRNRSGTDSIFDPPDERRVHPREIIVARQQRKLSHLRLPQITT